MKKFKNVALAFMAVFAFVATGCKPEGFVKVKGGTIIGADYKNNYTGVFPAGRTVTLSDFYMSKYEVTQAEYREVMQNQTQTVSFHGIEVELPLDAEPSICTANSEDYALDIVASGEKQEKRPVEGVTWYDAVYYCNTRSEMENLEKVYDITDIWVDDGHITAAIVTCDITKNGYRLPTEAEWEYAARGGDPSAKDWNYVFSGTDTNDQTYDDNSYPDSDTALDTVGWYCYNNDTGTTGTSDVTEYSKSCGTHEVGKKAANRLGFYDMSGNVWEWCWDVYDDISISETVTDPVGPVAGSDRVVRGGDWLNTADFCTVSNRYVYGKAGEQFCGFRVVRSAK